MNIMDRRFDHWLLIDYSMIPTPVNPYITAIFSISHIIDVWFKFNDYINQYNNKINIEE